MATPDFDRLLGRPLGYRGDPRGPVVKGFQQLQVPIHPVTVARLRSGATKGTKKEGQLRAAQLLALGVTPLKSQFFLALTNKALERRQHQIGVTPHRLSSKCYLVDIARSIGIHRDVLGRLQRAIRADMICTEAAGPMHPMMPRFLGVIERYLDDYTRGRRVYPGMRTLCNTWERERNRSLMRFYELMRSMVPCNTMATFVPYEIELIDVYVQEQASRGHRVTVMDFVILQACRDGTPPAAVVEPIRDQTGIPVDEDTIENYRGVIMFGTPMRHRIV